jgi:hypothetical protein
MVNEADIDAALAECELHLIPNYTVIADYYNVGRTTLARRHKGQTTSRAIANSRFCQCLTSEQEEVLIAQINKLTVRHMPPTSQIVKNMAEEIVRGEVYKNWTSNFIKRHQDRLHSLYLRNIDNQRVHAEYGQCLSISIHLYTPLILKIRKSLVDTRKLANILTRLASARNRDLPHNGRKYLLYG